VDFELSEEEEELAAGVRRLCEGRFPIERVRTLYGGPSREMWEELARAGVFCLRLPEEQGGAGLGMTHAVLVFEELGRALVPGPLVYGHLAAGLVEGCGDGTVVASGVERGRDRGAGRPLLVEHLASADTLVALDGSGVWQVETEGIEARPVTEPFDPLTPLHIVGSLPRGKRLGDEELAARWYLEGAVLQAASLLGIAEAATDMAVAYAREREQFGRPIGSFQAVKHLLADMFVRAEVARAAVYAAAVTLDDPAAGDPARATSVAKMEASDAAVANGRACVQAHGGMGFTWEVDVHLYLKRAHVLATSFGSADDHADTMASLLPG
jgi:alkylation response protein AidB-like acyl-CoA dehydrogenase